MNQYGQMPYTQAQYGQPVSQPIMGDPSMYPGAMGVEQLQDFCHRHMHYYVTMQTRDGMQYDGIIDGLDQDSMYMLLPDGDTRDTQEEEDDRFIGVGFPFGFGWPLGYGGYGYGIPRRFRRFRRYRFPYYSVGGFFFPF